MQVTLKTRVDAEVKENLIAQLSNKSFVESEALIAQVLNIQPKEHVKTKHQKDDSVRLELTFSQAQWQKLEKMRALVSHSLPYGSDWDLVLEYVADQMIQRKDKSRIVQRREVLKKTNRTAEYKDENGVVHKNELCSRTSQTEQPTKAARKSVPMVIQRKIFQRDQSCQFQDKITGHKCESKWKLTIDHIQPVWAKGNNEVENLRILCSAHNQETYRRQAHLSQSGPVIR